MRILRECLLLCTLIILLSGNVAAKFPVYDGEFTQNVACSQYDDPVNYRLPKSIKPISYDIQLIPQLQDDFKFKGYVTINAEVEQPTSNITLHVGNIDIETINILTYESNCQFLTSYNSVSEQYTISLPKTLKQGKKIIISFSYSGVLSSDMTGFYRSYYFDYDEPEQLKWLAATQLQPAHARHVFPCFDEPSFKANFTVRIERDNTYKTLSNMPLKASRVLQSGKILDIYEESIPMSTYLLAFVISDFNSLGDGTFKVWSKPSTIDQANYALEIGPKILELYEKKFNEKFPLPKMDMVAVPDFAAGAMENWGLVTYRENRMLYDEKESSARAQQTVASVIAHELAHMWFGNLVTPEWWSYFWISEAFARYFEYFGTAEVEKDWNMEEQFVVEQQQSALMVDGLESSLPMTREVSDKSQLAGIGDLITYNKGASIVRMMSLVFGNQIFEDALRSYIQNNKEKGVGHPDNLWAAIQDQINNESTDPSLSIDVKTAMDTWTTKAGYPLISVTINENGVLQVTQERFLLRNIDSSPTNITWVVPLTFTTQGEPNFENTIPKYWLSTDKSVARFETIDPKEWVIFNIQSSGFYRVNYDKRGWQNILNVLKTTKNLDEIHVLNRAAIVDDLLNLARAGYQSYDMVFEGLRYLINEKHYLPFKAAFKGLEYLNKRFSGNAEHFLFKMFALSLVSTIHTDLGYDPRENDDRLTILLRQEVNNFLCIFDNEECIMHYTDKFEQWRNDTNARIEPNERPTAYCTAIRHGTSNDWNFLYDQYSTSNVATDQTMILNALGCSQDTAILEGYLTGAISNFTESRIRKQDSTNIFAAVYNSGLVGATYTIDFVDKHHKEMEEYYGGQNTIATILDGVSQHLSTAASVDKFEKLIENHKEDFASIQKSLEYSLKVAKYELMWRDSLSASITQSLQTYATPLTAQPLL